MSRSTLYQVFKTTATEIKEYPNGWGSAPPLWDYLCNKYLGGRNWLSVASAVEDNELWGLIYRNDVSNHLKAALYLTFDLCVVSPYHFDDFSISLVKAHTEILNNSKWDWTHWESIANDIKNLSRFDKRAIGIGLGCTSVCDPWESWYGNNCDVSKITESKDTLDFTNPELLK